jgi:hypothetical protein
VLDPQSVRNRRIVVFKFEGNVAVLGCQKMA